MFNLKTKKNLRLSALGLLTVCQLTPGSEREDLSRSLQDAHTALKSDLNAPKAKIAGACAAAALNLSFPSAYFLRRMTPAERNHLTPEETKCVSSALPDLDFPQKIVSSVSNQPVLAPETPLGTLEKKYLRLLANLQTERKLTPDQVTHLITDTKEFSREVQQAKLTPDRKTDPAFQDGSGLWEAVESIRLGLERLQEQGSELRTLNRKTPLDVFNHLLTELTAEQPRVETTLQQLQQRLRQQTEARIQRLTRDLLAVRAEAFFRAGNLELAVSDLEKASETLPLSGRQLLRLAQFRWSLADSVDKERAESLKVKATQTFEALSRQTNSPDHPEALFLLGLSAKNFKRPGEAVGALNKLVTTYPQHARVVAATRLLGDLAFDRGEYPEARNHYRKVLASPEKNLHGYAFYRLAWCLRYLGETQNALEAYEKALAWTNQWEKTIFAQELEKYSRQDLLSLYADSGDLKEATAYFNRWKENESAIWLRALAKELESNGQFEQAERLYRFLVVTASQEGNNSALFADSARALEIAEKLGAWSRWAEALESFRTGPLSLAGTLPEAAPLEKAIRQGIITLNTRAKTAQTGPLEASAQTLYLETLGTRAESEEIWRLKAQREKNAQRFKDATVTLRHYLQTFSVGIEAAKREEAQRELVDVLQAQEKNLPSTNGPLSGISLELVEAGEKYLSAFPNSRHSRPIQLVTAQTLLKHQQFEKGITLNQKLFDFNAQDALAQTAFDALRATYYRTADWERTYRWSSEMAGRKMPGSEKYKAPLTTIRMESLFLWAEKTEDPVVSAKLYLESLRFLEMRPIWEKSLYNAAVRTRNANLRPDFLKVCDRLEKEFPASVHLVELAPARAAIYHESGDFMKSLPHLQFYLAQNPPASEAVQQARLNAALVLEVQGESERARDLLNLFLRSQPAPAPAALEEAQRATYRIAAKEGRALASVPEYPALLQRRKTFEKNPLGASGASTAARIRQGGIELEKLAKSFLAIAEGTQPTNDVAVESMCSVGLLYSAYEEELGHLAPSESPKLYAEVQKIRPALAAKAKEFGRDCLKFSVEREADSEAFRKINAKMGWEWDPILSERVKSLVSDLATVLPSWDAVPTTSEEVLLDEHLAGRVSEQSWYALTRIRCARGPNNYCRLTLSRAMELYPHSGKLMNGYALTQMKSSVHEPLGALFVRASKQGSASATANLAFYHLREGRWAQGREALKLAQAAGAFDALPQISGRVKEMLK